MKKNQRLIVFTIVLCAISALNVKVVLNTEHSSDLLMTSLAAIGEGNPSEGGESSSGWWDRKDYICEKVICNCVLYKYEAQRSVSVANGTGSVAHAWNCTTCGNCGIL